MVSLFNSLWSLFKNILSNYIPHKTIICDDKYLPWIHNNIQAVNSRENNTYRSYILSDKNPKIFENQRKCLIEGNKEKYDFRISEKVMDPITNAKNIKDVIKQ